MGGFSPSCQHRVPLPRPRGVPSSNFLWIFIIIPRSSETNQASVTSGLVVPVAIAPVAAWTPAPTARAPTPAAAARASSSSSAARLIGGRAHEGEVDVDGLVEKLGVVGAVDGGAGLLEGGVFDEGVALGKETVSKQLLRGAR